MSAKSFFEARITTYQHGSSEIDYKAVHKQMAAAGFKRVLQTTAQKANEVPGIYRIHNRQLTLAQIVELIRLSLAPLACGMAVQVLKVDDETLLTLTPPTPNMRGEADPGAGQSQLSEKAKAQSGYPAWRRPR